jgi:hypothetical protein
MSTEWLWLLHWTTFVATQFYALTQPVVCFRDIDELATCERKNFLSALDVGTMGASHTDYIVVIPYSYLGITLIAVAVIAVVLWRRSQRS